MERDDLKQAWQSLGHQLQQQNTLQLQQYRESKLHGISKSLRPGQLPREIYNYLSPRQHVTYYFDPQPGGASG